MASGVPERPVYAVGEVPEVGGHLRRPVAVRIDRHEHRPDVRAGVGEHLVEHADRRRAHVGAVRVAEEHEHRVAGEGRQRERLAALVDELEVRGSLRGDAFDPARGLAGGGSRRGIPAAHGEHEQPDRDRGEHGEQRAADERGATVERGGRRRDGSFGHGATRHAPAHRR